MLTSELTVHMLKMYCKEGTSVVLSVNTKYWLTVVTSKGPFKTPSITQKSKNKSCGHRWAEEPEQWTGKRHFIFLLPSSCASHSFCAKCSIHLAWLIKRLLPRLPVPLSTRQIAPLFKDLVHYVFVASGKVFTNNFRRTAFFVQLHANKDFQSSCELVT